MSAQDWNTYLVAVVARDDAAWLTDCLDGVAALDPAPSSVVVVDLDSRDGTADVAIAHHSADRVAVVPAGDLDRVLDAALPLGEHRYVLMLPGDRRPPSSWAASALAALAGAAVVFGPEADPRHVAIDRGLVGHLGLFAGAATVDEVTERLHASGHVAAVAEGMRLEAAVPLAPAIGSHPRTRPAAVLETAPPAMVSVVVCTRGRPDHLARCLRSLDAQTDRCHEVVVVDNNDVHTPDLDAGRPRWRSVHEPRRGLDIARNRGTQEARGSIVAFIDDDCEADPNWITNVRAAFADPGVGAVTGRVRPASLAQPSQRWFESHFSFDRGTSPTRFTQWDRRPWFPMWTGCVGTGCNMAFRTQVLAEIGGFDELLDMGTSIGGGGDLDVYARLIDAGAVIAYAPDALVWHHHRATDRDVRAQFIGYGVSIGALLAKTAIERPAYRTHAVRYFLDRLRVAARLSKQTGAGTHLVPVQLLLLDVAAQCAGPFVYLHARRRSRRRPRRR